MKIVCKLLAALLLWIFIACNDTGKGTAEAEKKASNETAADMMVAPQETTDARAVAPAPPAVEMYRFTPPKVVKDGEVIDQAPAPEALEDVKLREEEKPFNTEDYDRIVENRFLAATQNPLSTFS